MQVSSTKQQYDELVSIGLWDKDAQIRFFLEYAEEYKLSAHFLSFLTLKITAAAESVVSSANYSTEQLIEMLSKSERISYLIKERAAVTQSKNPWSASDMIECVAKVLSVSVEPENNSLVQELLTYFNVKHSFLIRSRNQSPDVDVVSDKYRYGARG